MSRRQVEQAMGQFRKSPAIYTTDEVSELDKAIRADTFGVTRRMGMVLLTRPGADLAASANQDRDFAVALAATGLSLRKYIECLEGLVADLRNAELRSLAALATRTDAGEIVSEAEAQEVVHG
jgi:hypothetical protein